MGEDIQESRSTLSNVATTGFFTSSFSLSSYRLCYCSGTSCPKLAVSFYSKRITAKGGKVQALQSDIPDPPRSPSLALPSLSVSLPTLPQHHAHLPSARVPHSLQTTSLFLSLDPNVPFLLPLQIPRCNSPITGRLLEGQS